MKKTKKILLKISEEDLQKIKDNANIHTKGNVSEWIRKSATKEINEAQTRIN